MMQTQSSYLVQILQQYISHIYQLQFGEYGKAHALCSFIKELAAKHFPDNRLYRINLQKIDFETAVSRAADKEDAWNEAIENLLEIVQEMLSESEKRLTFVPITNDKIDVATNASAWYSNHMVSSIILCTAFVSVSLWIWFFNDLLHWNWLSGHPKRIPILLTGQLLLILLIFLGSKASRRHKETAGIVLAVILAAIALL